MNHLPGIYSRLLAMTLMFPLLPVTIAVAEEKTPAQWVAQLGSDRLADREAASAALLDLGAQAREDVRAALDSKDPEIQSRVRKLWKTLRWDLVPGAEKETAIMMEKVKGIYVDQTREDPTHPDDREDTMLYDKEWKTFVEKGGAKTLLLIAEMRTEGFSAKTYHAGLSALLEDVPSQELIDLIKKGPDEKRLAAPFDAVLGNWIDQKGEASLVEIRAALHQYDRAYEFSRTQLLKSDGNDEEHLIAACAQAVKEGGMFDKVEADGLKEVAMETNPTTLCLKLIFYAGIMSDIDKKDRIARLCEAARNAAPGAGGRWQLISLVKVLLGADQPGNAVKMLQNVKTPEMLYMRSFANAAVHKKTATEADWKAAQDLLDAGTDAGQRKIMYTLIGGLMYELDDPHAEELLLRISSMPPEDHAEDSNAYFKLSAIYENRRQYQLAVDYYKKAMDSFAKSGALISITKVDGSRPDDGEEAMLDDYKRLQLLAAAQKVGTGAGGPAPAEPNAAHAPEKTP